MDKLYVLLNAQNESWIGKVQLKSLVELIKVLL